jgi:NADH:ubiquinone oxidoreductase subunit K
MLFGIGIYGLVTKRNALRMLFAVELLINAANLNFIAFSQYAPFLPAGSTATNGIGQTFVLFSIALAAAETAVILAIVVVTYRLHKDVDVSELRTMKG